MKMEIFQFYSIIQFSVRSEQLTDILEVSATKKSLRKITNTQSLSVVKVLKNIYLKVIVYQNKY